MHPVYFPKTAWEAIWGRQDHGYMAEIRLEDVDISALKAVRSALNAGSMFDRVQRKEFKDGNSEENEIFHYYIHGDFYKVLVNIRGRLLGSAMHPRAIGGPGGNGGSTYGGEMRERVDKLGPAPQRRQIPHQPSKPEKSEVGAAPVMQPPIHAAAETPAAASAVEMEKAHVYYWSELVYVLGIDPQSALQRLSTPEASVQAREVWASLMRLAEQNEDLAGFIEDHKEAQEDALSRTYTKLRGEANGDQALVDQLDRADDDIQRNLSMFMLFPENGLLDHLIANLERAAAPDDGIRASEQKLLDELRHIRASLREADLSDPESWTRIGQALQKVVADQRNLIARFTPNGDKRTLN